MFFSIASHFCCFAAIGGWKYFAAGIKFTMGVCVLFFRFFIFDGETLKILTITKAVYSKTLSFSFLLPSSCRVLPLETQLAILMRLLFLKLLHFNKSHYLEKLI